MRNLLPVLIVLASLPITVIGPTSVF